MWIVFVVGRIVDIADIEAIAEPALDVTFGYVEPVSPVYVVG